MKVNLNAPYRHDPFAAIRLLDDEQEDRERLVQATTAVYSKRSRPRITLRMAVIIIAAFLLSFLFLNVWPAKADSLTTNQIAQEIKQQSALSLHQNVAYLWASNLLAAQDPAVCSYCAQEPDSLQLSINAVLKAIGLEQSLAGLTFCNLTNCTIANSQSMIAIDDRVSVTLAPLSVHFGEIPVSTLEPASVALLGCGLLYFLVLRLPKRKL